MIVAVYRLQLYVIPKILTELKIFQGGQGPPLSALMCCFFSHRPVATTFSPVMGTNKSRAVLPFFTQASGHNFQPCCGPVFKTRADSGPCGMLIATLFFFFQFCMQARGHVFQPCYGHEPEQGCAAFVHTGHTDRKQYLKTVLASCVVPVYCLSFGVQ